MIEALESRRLLAIAAPGLPDPAFGEQGAVFTDFFGEKQRDQLARVLPMPDGRFVAAGSVTSPWWEDVRSYRPAVARYHADGSLDRTFGDNGSATGDVPGLQSIRIADALLEPDGSVVLYGIEQVKLFDPTRIRGRVALLRYTPQGQLDTAFGQGGVVLIDQLALDDVFLSISSYPLVRQPNGKLLILAQRKQPGAPGGAQNDPVVVARLNADGSIDDGFGADGIAVLPGAGNTDRGKGLLVRGDGKVVALMQHLTTEQGSVGALVQLTESGAPDTSFGGGDGVAPVPPPTSVEIGELTAAGDGGYLFGSWRHQVAGSFPALELTKLTADGVLDNTFGSGGIASHAFDGVSIREADVLVQPDGRIVVAATSADSGVKRQPLLARLNADGSVDTTFASAGLFRVSTAATRGADAASVALAADGSILVGATALFPSIYGATVPNTQFMLMRFGSGPAGADGPAIGVGLGTLTVRGTSGNDSIRIRTRADPRIEVTVNELVESFAAGNVVTIHVTGGGGDDWIDARELGILKRDGFDFPVTIEGGDGNDIIAGSDGRDRIRGEFGNDRIDGGGGDDSLSGNANHDRVHGGTGNDVIFGAGGIDVLVGDADDDEIYAGDHNDLIYGSLGNDFLNGEGGNDKMFGEEGNDQLFGGAGHDTLDGGVGSDNLAGSAGNDLFLARDGLRDRVAGGWEGFDRAEVDDELDEVTGIEELLA